MSKLHYGLVFTLSDAVSETSEIQKLQNRGLRICTLSGRYVSNLLLHASNNVMPINLRSKLDLLILMFKLVARRQSMNESYSNASRISRMQSAPIIEVVIPNSHRFIKTTSYVDPVTWQSLLPCLRQMTDLDSFKKQICVLPSL